MDTLILAVVIGAAFGASLDRVGATNPNYIIKMLNLTDLHLMKTILLGIGVASVLLFAGALLGVVDVGHLSVKTTFAGVFLGGILLGTGFAIAGYCPGTGLAALATGRKDAAFFVVGGLLGAGAYMLAHATINQTGLLTPLAGGKTTLGKIANTDIVALFSTVSGEWIGIVVGLVFITIAAVLPLRLRG